MTAYILKRNETHMPNPRPNPAKVSPAKSMALRQRPQVRASAAPKSAKDAIVPGPSRTTVGPAGRIVIPAPMRAALGMEEGAQIVLVLVGEELHVMTQAAAMRKAQAMVRARIPASRSLVDELIDERARENAVEFKDG